jgi:hypothetical protein
MAICPVDFDPIVSIASASMGHLRLLVSATLIVVSGFMCGSARAATAGLPSLCKLQVGAQLKALALLPTCSVGPVSALSGAARERQVSWGTQGDLAGLTSYRSLGVVVYTGVSAATFAKDYALGSGTGVSVAVGQGGREQVAPHLLELSTFAGGVGIEAVFQVTPQNTTSARGPFLAFVKTFAAHV